MSNGGKWGDGDGAAPGFVPWIFAVADPDPGWWERQRSNPKRMGELSQAAFLVKAQSLGFGLALPWGDSEKYDFIVWARPQGRLLRVQVKATGRLNCGGYDVQPVYSTRGEGKKSYTAADIDVLAAHVIIEGNGGKEVWYLLPIAAFAGVKSLRLYPDLEGQRARWEGVSGGLGVAGLEQGSGVRGQRSGVSKVRISKLGLVLTGHWLLITGRLRSMVDGKDT
jgi:hypothetical protein